MSNKLTPKEASALQHWSMYGQGGGPPPATRVEPMAWKTKPFLAPVTTPWALPVPRAVLSRLLLGFRPQAMEDKWFVAATGPDPRGNVVLYLHRSWTGHAMAEVRIKVPQEGGQGGGAAPLEDGARVTKLIWESSKERYSGQTAEGAKVMVRSVCEWVLRVKLPES